MKIDTTQLAGLARDLHDASSDVRGDVVKVVKKAATNVKKNWRENAAATAGAHASQYPSTISYDIKDQGLSAEIGPEKRGQGNLGNLLEFGSANNPPHNDGKRALDKEEPRFEKAISDVVGKVLR